MLQFSLPNCSTICATVSWNSRTSVSTSPLLLVASAYSPIVSG